MSKQQADLNRRSLLKALTIGGTASVAIAATGIKVAHATEQSAVKSNTNGYQETAHIRSYYDSLRG
ncbi:twin-arginine translocation signal domain-containing protein [Shewanella aestuarii]|uniref:Twin-arginine translocation signal domain-containing protein n=1 Tax=Shewanella aestuarii TaxID=1028752 RepID=A0A6G9QF66_9GAMM|nr:twin-arginine translocation signal domain-containing protein [Shewanella aestuarii]QIR13122.1 twin-arginine translocation signal domain-containing protein [Shewanella aestuarii]